MTTLNHPCGSSEDKTHRKQMGVQVNLESPIQRWAIVYHAAFASHTIEWKILSGVHPKCGIQSKQTNKPCSNVENAWPRWDRNTSCETTARWTLYCSICRACWSLMTLVFWPSNWLIIPLSLYSCNLKLLQGHTVHRYRLSNGKTGSK